MLRKRSIVIVAIVAASALATPDWSVGQDETIWTMAISGTRVEEPSGPVFEMWAIEYKSGTLTGTCSFANFQTSRYKPVKVTIKGEWRDGSFWPALKGQVGDRYKGPWYTIPAEAKKMKLSKVEVLPGQEMSKWRVGLNDFLPYVGNYKVGRIVLASGDFAVFELKGLKGADHD